MPHIRKNQLSITIINDMISILKYLKNERNDKK